MRNYMKQLCDFDTIKASYHPAKFVCHSHYGSGVTMILICHVALQDHLVKGLCDIMVGSPK